MNMSTKRFVSFLELSISFLHICMFPACCFYVCVCMYIWVYIILLSQVCLTKNITLPSNFLPIIKEFLNSDTHLKKVGYPFVFCTFYLSYIHIY